MDEFRRLRALLHRPYLRAAVLSLALATAAGAAGIVALELRFGVPARAVVRYFSRLHSAAEDLTPLLRQPATLAALAELPYASSGMNSGGLVYSEHGRLRFYTWMPESAALADRRSLEHEAIYTRLLPKYLAAELDELLSELAHPRTRRGLGRLGLAPDLVERLRLEAAADPPPAERLRLLRTAAHLIRPFMPTGADRHQLELADKLRFYSSRAPAGRYLGLFEVNGPAWLARGAPVPLPDSGRLLAITKLADGAILVEDLRPDRRRTYRLTPIRHPAGLPLYRIASRA